ncbi:hypothetical protein QF000_006666 [Paraburkholderia atlantica]|uniref:hypothetical protein n=1 Tax=Paraburkholderia atlantica TaxID=2654982 RepID=UPI003D2561F4
MNEIAEHDARRQTPTEVQPGQCFVVGESCGIKPSTEMAIDKPDQEVNNVSH